MATWNSDNIILTKLGEQVLSKVQSGVGKLTVSRIVSGAGHVSPAQLYSQTQITDIKQEMSVVKYTTNEQQSVISANLTNTGLEEAYDLYQIGIYVTHPDFTDEVLYLIAQCDSPDHIPLPGDNPVTLSYDLVMAHFGTKEVTINVSEAGHVDVTTFNEFIEKTNTALNRKADLSDIPTTLPANGGNADTVGGKHAYEFSQIVDYGDSPTSTNTVPPSGAITIYRCSNWTNYPDGASDGKGILIVACYEGFGFVGASDMWVRQLYITPHNNYKIWQRVITDTTVGEWTNIADGGNADTVGNKGISQILAVKGYFSGNMDNLKEQGSYIANEATNMPISGGWGTVLVFAGGTGSVVQVFTAYVTSTSDLCKTYIRHFTGELWSTWVNIADSGNADTLDGKHASDFSQIISFGDTPTDTKTAIGIQGKTTTYWCSKWTDYPATLQDGQGMIIAVNYKISSNGDTWCRQIYITPHNSKIYQRLINRTTVGEWVNIADGGNAASVEGKSLSDLMVWGMSYDERTKITSGDLNNYTAVGSYVVTTADVAATITNSPWTRTGYFLDVYYRTSGYCVQVAMTWDGYIKIRALNANTWYDWRDIVHSNYIASSTTPGIVTTGTQQFAGYKIFPTQIAIKTAGTVGTQPTSDINSRMFFTNTALNAQFGEVRNCIRDSSFTTGEVFTSIYAFSNDHTGSNTIKVVATNNNSGNYVSIGAPTVASSVSCLRNLSSGTASANTTNCPSGSWYGKHS